MNDAKYIGLDVHPATISVAVLDVAGKLVMAATLETQAETILQFCPRPARQFACDLRRRNLCRLIARSAPGELFPLTLPFIERSYRTFEVPIRGLCTNPTAQELA